MNLKKWLLIVISGDCPLCGHILRLVPQMSESFKLNIEVKKYYELTVQEINMMIQNNVLTDDNDFNVPLFIFYKTGTIVDRVENLPDMESKTPKTAFKELIEKWQEENNEKK